MKKKNRQRRTEGSPGGFTPLSSSADFYAASPAERPLNDDNAPSNAHDVRETMRHRTVAGRRLEKMDPREKMALVAILKLVVLIIAVVIAFLMLRKGIGLYEESIWMEHAGAPEKSPVLETLAVTGDFDIRNQESPEQFAERIALWKEADRLVDSADALLRRNIHDQAIEQCQQALRHDPSHRGALDRLGQLYYAKGAYVEAANAYIRLLSVDPSHAKTQKRLIEALDALGDSSAVKYMAEWYLEGNVSDSDVERYLANALYAKEDYAGAAKEYARVLRTAPLDVEALEKQASAYMLLQQYEDALVPLDVLRRNYNQNPDYYRQVAICRAQLKQAHETVQTLALAAQVFGQQRVLGFLPDPKFDPVREERVFQAFVDRVGGRDFRMGIEELARRARLEAAGQEEVEPLLEMPESE